MEQTARESPHLAIILDTVATDGPSRLLLDGRAGTLNVALLSLSMKAIGVEPTSCWTQEDVGHGVFPGEDTASMSSTKHIKGTPNYTTVDLSTIHKYFDLLQ